jgi:hypothetical protein
MAVDFGLSPSTVTTINSLALLGVAVIGAWTAAKQSARDKEVASIKKTGEAVHTLTNSAMGAQLKNAVVLAKQSAAFAHRVADSTKEAGDIAAAVAADTVVEDQEAILQIHLMNQAKADAIA